MFAASRRRYTTQQFYIRQTDLLCTDCLPLYKTHNLHVNNINTLLETDDEILRLIFAEGAKYIKTFLKKITGPICQ